MEIKSFACKVILVSYSLLVGFICIPVKYTEKTATAWKASKYGVISGPYSHVFRLNTESYGVNLRIQSEYKKI